MENLKNSNKRWHKLNNEETSVLKNMMVNNSSKKLGFNDVRDAVKKEIWKLVMNEVKKLEKGMQAKNIR
jgi:hypothetical protein